MLDKSREFVVDLCHFVEEFYSEMAESTAITPEEAWRLTTALIYEVFSELHNARSIVKQAKEAESLLHVWGALTTQEVMQRFVDNQFRDDSALTGILVRHIIPRNNEADGSGAMGRKITRLEGKLVTAQYNIKKKMDNDLVTRELAKKVDR
jgi:cell division protein YceG involved in septum cleavage